MSEDLIKRSDAIKVVSHVAMECIDRKTRIELINTIPSADRPQGEWKFASTFTDSVGSEFAKVKCSHCGYEAFALARFVKDGNYCPNCGCRMKGASNGEDIQSADE